MAKPIHSVLKLYKTLYGASLQVMLSECNFGCEVSCTEKNCIFKHLYIQVLAKSDISNSFSSQYFSLKGDYKIHKINIFRVAIKEKKINTVSCKISDQSNSLVITGEKNDKCQINSKLNRQLNIEDINLWLKLYRSFLSKYRYTSLELVVRSAAFLADAVAKFRTDNPVRVGSSENNKEHCHLLMAASNYS
jgi:hypothetical protein